MGKEGMSVIREAGGWEHVAWWKSKNEELWGGGGGNQ
jgi:hypothetical protein